MTISRFTALDDTVSQDLGISYHLVGVEEYKEWQWQGFKADLEELEREKSSDEDRIMWLSCGSAFRKGSKRGPR